jgi:hypothetical protein
MRKWLFLTAIVLLHTGPTFAQWQRNYVPPVMVYPQAPATIYVVPAPVYTPIYVAPVQPQTITIEIRELQPVQRCGQARPHWTGFGWEWRRNCWTRWE